MKSLINDERHRMCADPAAHPFYIGRPAGGACHPDPEATDVPTSAIDECSASSCEERS